MPNWCFGTLCVSGDRAEVDRLIDLSRKENDEYDLTFVKPIPDGPNVTNLDRVKEWGTKWPPRITDLEITQSGAELRFESAWSPPSRLILLLSEHFPTLSFVIEYSESGIGFAGSEAFRSGVTVYDGCFDYSDVEGFDDKLATITDDMDHDERWAVWEDAESLVHMERDRRNDEAWRVIAEIEDLEASIL